MTEHEFNPFQLDVVAFAKAAGHIEGHWPLAQLDRLAESAVAEEAPTQTDGVAWSARGENRPARGGGPQPWLHVKAQARIALECQRCLRPVEVILDADRSFLFVPGEEAAAKIDADSEHDVLALTKALDLRELAEDELLLAMPLVPRHDVCPVPLEAPENDEEAMQAPNPFAALAALKRDGGLT